MNILDLLKILNMTNQTNFQTDKSPSFDNYPHEAYSQNHQNNNFLGDNNILPLLMSLLGKNNDFNKIFTQNTEKKEVEKSSTSPKDELLL